MKSPSKSSLYEVFAVDGFRTKKKVMNIARFFRVPKFKHVAGSRIPPCIVINILVPNYSPPIFGDTTDGDGFNMLFFAKLSADTRRRLEENDLTPAMQLFGDFVHAKPGDPVRKCLKCIARIMNNSKASYGRIARNLVAMYNSTPFLARTSTTFYHVPGHYFAVDV